MAETAVVDGEDDEAGVGESLGLFRQSGFDQREAVAEHEPWAPAVAAQALGPIEISGAFDAGTLELHFMCHRRCSPLCRFAAQLW